MNILLGFMCADLVEEVEDEEKKSVESVSPLGVCTPAGMDFGKTVTMNQSPPKAVKVEKGGRNHLDGAQQNIHVWQLKGRIRASREWENSVAPDF